MVAYFELAYAVSVAGIVLGLVAGVRVGNRPAVANATGALVVAFLPTIVEIGLGAARLDVSFTTGLSLALAVAGVLHVIGMLGWYDTVPWWDHLTHTVSAAVLAAIVHASLHTVDAREPGVDLSEAYTVAFTLLFVLAAGVCWELFELYAHEIGDRVGAPPVLEHYGLRDTVLDLVFDVVGAILIIAANVRTLGTVTEHSARLANLGLATAVVLIFGSTVVLGVVLDHERGRG